MVHIERHHQAKGCKYEDGKVNFRWRKNTDDDHANSEQNDGEDCPDKPARCNRDSGTNGAILIFKKQNKLVNTTVTLMTIKG